MGMSQPVVLKSNRYGINLILDADMPFGQLEEAILEKFRESEKFFKNAKIAISFEGRRLSQEEEFSILDMIAKNTSIQVICVVDQDEMREQMYKEKIDSYYQEQIKPYMEYFDEAEDKAEAFAFCRERMEADMTTEAPCLKEMSRELSERLRRFGGTWAEQGALQKEAMNHIRLAPDREQAFASITGEMDRALERSRGLGR